MNYDVINHVDYDESEANPDDVDEVCGLCGLRAPALGATACSTCGGES